jgi:hypothetical protein
MTSVANRLGGSGSAARALDNVPRAQRETLVSTSKHGGQLPSMFTVAMKNRGAASGAPSGWLGIISAAQWAVVMMDAEGGVEPKESAAAGSSVSQSRPTWRRHTPLHSR